MNKQQLTARIRESANQMCSKIEAKQINLVMCGIKPGNIETRSGGTLADDWPYLYAFLLHRKPTP